MLDDDECLCSLMTRSNQAVSDSSAVLVNQGFYMGELVRHDGRSTISSEHNRDEMERSVRRCVGSPKVRSISGRVVSGVKVACEWPERALEGREQPPGTHWAREQHTRREVGVLGGERRCSDRRGKWVSPREGGRVAARAEGMGGRGKGETRGFCFRAVS